MKWSSEWTIEWNSVFVVRELMCFLEMMDRGKI